MIYPQYQIVTGSTSVIFANAIATQSLDGWLIVGAVAVSGSGFAILMTRGVGVPVPLTEETHSVHPYKSPDTASGIWQNIVPPQTANDTLLGINTDPNVNPSLLRPWTLNSGHRTSSAF